MPRVSDVKIEEWERPGLRARHGTGQDGPAAKQSVLEKLFVAYGACETGVGRCRAAG